MIQHPVWLYHCFSLSLRDVELILAACNIVVSDETIRYWSLRCGRMFANELKRRRLPRPLPANRAWVNVADEQLVLYRAGQPVFSTRVVVGEDVERNQSPEFRATIDASFYNPPWVIPVDIAAAEILPRLGKIRIF